MTQVKPHESQPRRRHFGPIASFWRHHSLGMIVFVFLGLWTALYHWSDPNTHLGAFYGNAIADWCGALTIVLVTRRLHERHSRESTPFRDRARTPLGRLWEEHSLSFFLGAMALL